MSTPRAACSVARSNLSSMTTRSSASETPAIYSKLIDVDKVDLLFAPYATVPTAPIMPMVKQRGLLLIGNFSFQVNSKVGHDMWFNNAPWGAARQLGGFVPRSRPEGRRQDHRASGGGPGIRPESRQDREEVATKRNMQIVFDQAYPPNTVEFSSIIRALKAAKPDIVYVASYPPDSAGILRAVNEIGIGDNVKIFGGGMVGLQFGAVMENMGSLLNGVVNYNSWLPEKSMYYEGTKDVLRYLFETCRGSQGRSAGLLSCAIRLRQRSTCRAGHQGDRVARPKGASQNICARTSTRPSSARSRFRRMASARKPRCCRPSSAASRTRTSSSSAARASR